MIGAFEIAVTESGSGPAFFWGHGFASSTEQESTGLIDWKRLAAGHRVVRWDAPGHGRSRGGDDPASYRWDVVGAGLPALADRLGIGTFAAGGVSMGAATALWCAVTAPDRVTELVLALPPTAFETRSARRYHALADLVTSEGVGAYVEEMKQETLPPMLRDIAAAYDYSPTVAADRFPFALRGAGDSDLPAIERLRTVAVPVLILAWDGDVGHPLSTAELLAETLPAAELEVAEDLTAVLGWTERVARFLDQGAG